MLAPLARALLDAIGKPALLVDSAGAILAANREAARLLARPEADILGANVEAVFGGGGESPSRYVRRCLSTGQSTLGALTLGATGEVLRCDGTRLARNASDRPMLLLQLTSRSSPGSGFAMLNERLAALGKEVVRRRRLEAELAAKVDELKQVDSQKNRFIAILSHELRNPLAPIRMLLYMLQLDGGQERARQAFPVMERHLLHLIRLVDDLLDFSRINTGKIRVDVAEVALAPVLELAASGARAAAEAKQVALDVALPAEVTVRADAHRLRQVVGNLLDNAVKFTPPQGQVQLAAAVQGDGAVIRVKDSGPGIPREFAPRIFEFFSQYDSSAGGANPGLGLGLGLARTLIEMQGGSIALGQHDQGAEFLVTVPLARPATVERTRADATAAA